MAEKISFSEETMRKGVSRRNFMKFCGIMAAALALPVHYTQVIADALAANPRLPVIWLEFQDCTGDSESFLRAGPRVDPVQPGVTDPAVIDLVLDFLSIDYHETLMVPSGFQAEKSLNDTLANYAGQYVCVVEGSIPMANNGVYCTIRGRTALSIAQQVIPAAAATIALGSCAWDGGLAAAAPNLTGATGVRGAIPGVQNLVNLPGCPSNVVNLVATLVHYITFQQWPAMNSARLPLFAYGDKVHEECERHDFYEEKQFVLAWGDAGHQAGWCLYRMGCRGPDTKSNCPQVKWVDGTNWPIGAGHGCIGCTTSHFWDTKTPFYAPGNED